LDEAGTLASTIAMSGGTLDADNSSTLSGTLTQSGNITIDVAADKTLTYSGDEISLGAYTLTLSGGGTLVSGGLTLNDADSKLLLNSIIVDNVSTSANSLGLDVDNNSTITALSVGHITPVSIASGRTLSGAITVTAGSIKLDETGTLASTIAMSGGELDADNSSTLSGTLTQSGNITIDVADNKTLTYSGAAISLGANTLTLSGGGSLVSGGLTLNNASSKLLLSSITLDNVTTSADSLGLDVDNNSTITALSVANITPVSIASGSSLSGGITVTAGSLKLNETGTLASTIAMSGGVLDADNSSTVSGALSHTADITIDVANNKTLTYTGAPISLGANTLTLSGGGSLVSGGLTLDNASSNLVLNSIIVDIVSTTSDSLGLDVDNNSTVTCLTVGHTTPVSIASSRTLSGGITVTAGSIKLAETGTLASTISMSGGVLDADESLTLSGALTHSGEITIDVADNKTLTYSGTALSLGANTMTLSGGGTLSNTNALVLNDANSLLSLAGILTIGDVDGTTASNSGKGIRVTSSASLGDYDLSAVSYLDIAANKTLAGQLNLQTNGELKTSGDGQYIGDIALAGGKFSATVSQVLSGTLSITADSELRVSETYILTLSQAGGLALGANTLTLSGGGSLVSGGVTLNNADSKLLLNSITVDNVSTTSDSLGLDVDAVSTVTSLSVANITPVSIAAGKSLSGAITVSAGSIKLDEAGTLASTISMSGGTLDADNSSTLSGTLTQAGNIMIDVADNKTLTYSGTAISLGANTLTLIGGGTLSNTNALVLNNADSLLSLAGILVIGDVDGTTASNPNKGIQVTSSATLGDYDLSAVSYLSIAANKTLAGQLNLQTNGELKTSGDGQYIGDIALAGGKFSATDNQVLGGTLSITADSELSVSQTHILTLSQTGGLALGANTLTLSGGGSLVSGGLTLNNASSKLLLNSITVDNVSTTVDNSLGVDVDNDSTITSLSVANITPVSIASGKTLSGAITLKAGSIKLDETGTLASTVEMGGGTLDADESLTVSGALTQSGDTTIDVLANKTLTYSGAPLSLGAYTLTLTGGGNLASGGLDLNNANSKLLLNSITVDSVSTTVDNSLGVDVDNDSTITSLSVANITPVSIASGKTLSGAITVTAGSIKLAETGTLASSISMSGGTLDADNSLTVSGALTHTAT